MHILAITPGRGFDPAAWSAVLRSGVDGFLVREPDLQAGELLRVARWCREAAPEVELWIRGRLDVALVAPAGLHAPERHPEVPPDLLPLSRPLHAPSQYAPRRGVRQLLLSPIFATPGKGETWGLPALHAFLDGLAGDGPRLLALGGIDALKAGGLRHPRLAGVAVIRALWEAPVPARAVEGLRKAWA
jgi:thiamine-phosphate pyrophosphorylase